MLLLLYAVERIEMWDLEKWVIKSDSLSRVSLCDLIDRLIRVFMTID